LLSNFGHVYTLILNGALYLLDLIPPLNMGLATTQDRVFLDILYRDSRPELLDFPLAPNALEQMIAMQQMSQSAGVQHAYPYAKDWLLRWSQDAIGRLILDEGQLDIRLVDIAVLSAWRGQGVAKCVLHALQTYAASIDKSISLAVQCDNLIARHLYQRAGFVLRSTDMLFDQMTWHPAKI
jgi:ribosomal protein S18 acetylase RimI-like enzyme